MGRIYTARFEAVNVSAAQDVFSLGSPTSGVGLLHAVYLSQTSDVGDSAEIIEEVRIVTGNTTVGSGGSAPTAIPFQLGDTPTVTVRANDTTEVSAGTQVIKFSDAWNVRVGWQYLPTPETRIYWNELIAGTKTFLAIQLPGAPASAITMTGTIIFEEILG
ncbi:hypothetical protein LCGC14_0581870 [marine sediment metagenome]|uniref:Uncharacterized protein n=1 Tax=marine sediment metagenome TaxID=412755 RepID=A0A0F9RZY0_9ZZZZ